MNFRARLVRLFYFIAARLLFLFFTRLNVEGKENIPGAEEGPFILVANHFSLFEVPLMAVLLPQVPIYFGAAELLSDPIVKYGQMGFKDEIIFVKRGQIDRQSLKLALQVLKNKRWLAIFPEGGITETSIAMGAGGEPTDQLAGHNSRASGELLTARPGAAMLAVQSKARILPMAFIGTEKIEAGFKKWGRVPVTVRIGRPFGPLEIPPEIRGRERRQQIDVFGHQMMEAVARLFPAEQRGPYAYIEQKTGSDDKAKSG